jgi:hypothetical protein
MANKLDEEMSYLEVGDQQSSKKQPDGGLGADPTRQFQLRPFHSSGWPNGLGFSAFRHSDFVGGDETAVHFRDAKFVHSRPHCPGVDKTGKSISLVHID